MMTKHGYEDVSVKDIRQELISLGVEDENILSQSKKPLVDLLLKTKEQLSVEPLEFDSEDEDILSAIDTDALSESSELLQPDFNSESWSEWVVSKFADDELENGAPTCTAEGRCCNGNGARGYLLRSFCSDSGGSSARLC